MEIKPRYSPESMGAVENINKEVNNLLRTFVLFLKELTSDYFSSSEFFCRIACKFFAYPDVSSRAFCFLVRCSA